MAHSTAWPVPVTTVGASRGGSVVFRKNGQLHVTCVLKSTFRFVPDKPMDTIESDDIIVSELHHRENPSRSIRATSEVVPYLPRVDVFLTGHAYAPAGHQATRMTVRLSIYHSIALLEKKIDVVGDRNGTDLVPFQRIPLVYEKAVGGIGDALNPWGTGKSPGSALPNLIHPKDPDVVVGFGPIARGLRHRKTLRGSMTTTALDESFIEFPNEFDWNYYQAAPADQQLASVVGNEWIILEGLHPKLPRIASRLPTVRPIATVFGINPAKPEVAKAVQARIDMICIDADELKCSVIGRAVIPIDDERALRSVRIIGAVETEELTYAHMLTPPVAGKQQSLEGGTVSIAARKKEPENGTLVLGDAPSGKNALPFDAKKEFDIEDEATIDMDIASHHEEGKKPATPFPAPGPKRASASRRAPIPGAPWSPEPARKPKGRSREGTVTDVTLATLDETTRKFVKPDLDALGSAPLPVIPPVPVPEPLVEVASRPAAVVHTTPTSAPAPENTPERKTPAAPTKDMWAKTGHELPIAITKPPPPPPRIPAKPAVNKAIYGAFGPPKKKT